MNKVEDIFLKADIMKALKALSNHFITLGKISVMPGFTAAGDK